MSWGLTVREALIEAWALASARAPQDDAIRMSEIEVATGASAVISKANDRGVLFILKEGERVRLPAGYRRAALDVEVQRFEMPGRRVRAFAVWCREPALDEPFISFTESLLREWLDGRQIGDAFAGCYARFRRLFEGSTNGDVPRLAGLIGELIFLNDLLEASPRAVRTWFGTKKERHDFRAGAVAVEVKTTLRADTTRKLVRISAIDQMEPPEGGTLYLHAIQLERNPSGSIRLLKLVQAIERRLASEDQELFRVALGELPSDEGPAFSQLSRTTYEVREGFPRLTASRLRSGILDPGIANVTYEIDLGNAASFAVDDTTAILGLSRAGGHP